MSLTALYTVDRFGQRKTLLTGLVVMTILWILIGVLLKFYLANDSTASVPHGFTVLFIWLFYRYVSISRWRFSQALIEFISTYVMSWGPCGWWVPMEVLPTNL